MHPAEQAELLFQVTLLQRHDESYKANYVERKADNPMVRGEREEICIRKDDMLRSKCVRETDKTSRDGWDRYLEVINDTLSIQEIVCRGEEVPIQCLTPRILVLELHGFEIHERE